MRCQKCHKKTMPIEGRVMMQIGDTTFSTITEVGHCGFCNIQTVQFQCKIEPLFTKEEVKGEVDAGTIQ